MEFIEIKFEVPLDKLTPVGGDTYEFIIKFFKSPGVPLDHPSIPNLYNATVVTITPNFVVKVPVTPGSWAALDVLVALYAGDENNCCSQQTVVDLINTGSPPPVQGDFWGATKTTTVSGKRYTWIDSENATIEVAQDGKIKLIAAAEKSSFDGSASCIPFLLDANYRGYSPDFCNKLLGAGAGFPYGQHEIYVLYIDAPDGDWNYVEANIWELLGNPQTHFAHSALPEKVSFSVEPVNGINDMLPYSQSRTGWLFTAFYLGNNLSLPEGKSFAVSRFVNDSTGLVDKEASITDIAMNKVTHIVDMYDSDVRNYIPASRRWRTAKCEVEHFNQHFDLVLDDGVLYTLDIQTQASNPAFMIGNWHRHTFLEEFVGGQGGLNGCNYSSEDLGGGLLRFKIANNTSALQKVLGSVNVRVVWTPQVAADNFEKDPGFMAFAEFAENGMLTINGDAFSEIEYSFMLDFAGVQAIHPAVTTPAQTNIVSDYYAPVWGYGAGGGSYIYLTPAEKKARMASVAAARGTSAYYANQAYMYRNRMGGVKYHNGWESVRDGKGMLGLIYDIEVDHIAMHDVKDIGLAWQATDGTGSFITTHGINYRLTFPPGDIIKRAPHVHSHEFMKFGAFFQLLLASGHALWEAGALFCKNPYAFVPDWVLHNNKVLWQTDGGPVEEWQAGNPAMVQPDPNADTAFPNAPQLGEQGAWCGAYVYSQISTASDRVSGSIAYAKYTYKVNGGAPQNGYGVSDAPKAGALGNAELSRFGLANVGQDNIVDIGDLQVPIVILTQGMDGYGLIVKNFFCEPDDVVTYSVQVGAQVLDFELVGTLLHVQYVNAALP
ncbi:hypothetical protein [Dyadobacter sp. BHUBP1]|uniref:hypothetical protein n=1 Tax=Dyadobacter sp. BHUBP1 TaxID=3424178 RepID=UPI003D33FA98